MNGHMYDWSTPFRFFNFGMGGMFMWIFIVIIIAVIVYFVVKEINKKSENESPLDIAKKRYAKGEINKTEFDEIKKNL